MAYDFALPLVSDLAIAQEGGQDLLMPQVLAPRLELFRSLADLLAELDKGVSETMRVEIREAGTDRGLAKDLPNGRGIAPVLSGQPCRSKLSIRAQRNARHRKERIIIAPSFSSRRKDTHSSTIPCTSSPTGKKKVLKVLPNFVFTSRASWLTQPAIRSTCLSFSDGMALSLAPVSSVNATKARFRQAVSVSGMARDCFIMRFGKMV
jgi:hypothetical protein